MWLAGGPYLSEARAGQCPAPRRQPPKLEVLFAVPDRFSAGRELYNPPVWHVFLSGALKEFYGPFYDPPNPVEMLLWSLISTLHCILCLVEFKLCKSLVIYI